MAIDLLGTIAQEARTNRRLRTRYMNSPLQTLYHIPYFRKAAPHMPTTKNDMPSGSIALALQILFLQTPVQ